MSETKLLPCPFCGGEAIDTFNTSCGYVIYCENEDCIMNQNEVGFETLKQAIKAWNTRKPMDDIVERLEEKDDDCGCGKIDVWEAIDIVRNAGKEVRNERICR